MKKLLSFFMFFILSFATSVYALDLQLKTDTTSFIKTSTTTTEEPVLQKTVHPTPVVTPATIVEPEKEIEVSLPSKTEDQPDSSISKPLTSPQEIEIPIQVKREDTPVFPPSTPILQKKESVLPVKEIRTPSIPEKTLNTPDETISKKIIPEESGLGELFNTGPQTAHSVLLTVEEENDTPLYIIKPSIWDVEFTTEATGTKEIITIPVEKNTLFDVKKHMFTVDEKKFEYSALENSEDNYFIGINLKTASSSKTSHFEAKAQDGCLSLYFGADSENSIDVCDNFETTPEGVYVSDGTNKYKLNTNPDLIFEALKNSVEKENAHLIEHGKLTIQDNSPVYQFDITEQHKFLWLFPVEVTGVVSIDAKQDILLDTEYNWLGSFFKNKDYAYNFVFKPNLTFTNMVTEPVSVHMGGQVTFKGTVTNNGSARASASHLSELGLSAIKLYFGGDLEIDSQETGFYIDPGESITVNLAWTAVLCNVPVAIKIDPENVVDELHEDDNVWNWTVTCAPTDAPDLVIDPITYNNNYKRIGTQNTMHFTFRNIGTQPSPEQTSFYYYEGLASSIIVPPLAPNTSWSTTRTVIPKNCDSVKVVADTSNIVTEIQEGNNVAFEEPSIIESCNHRPDLFVDAVWWKAGGYTAGDIHAGEELWFEYTVKNDPISFSNHDACLSGFKTSLKLNGTVIKSENLGWIGCVDDYAYSLPDYWTRKGHFTYTPQCNGEKLTIEVDPGNTISEGIENNNTWNFDIVCTLPPPTIAD